MKNSNKVTNAYTPIDEKDVVNKECFNSNFILGKNKTELRKVEFDKNTSETLQLKKYKLTMN